MFGDFIVSLKYNLYSECDKLSELAVDIDRIAEKIAKAMDITFDDIN